MKQTRYSRARGVLVVVVRLRHPSSSKMGLVRVRRREHVIMVGDLMAYYFLLLLVSAPLLFYLTLPNNPYNRLPIERLEHATNEIQHLIQLQWGTLTMEERIRAKNQTGFVDGLHVVLAMVDCDHQGKKQGGGWKDDALEQELDRSVPETVRFEVTRISVGCGGAPLDGGHDPSFVWRDGTAVNTEIGEAEDLLLTLSHRARVVRYAAVVGENWGGDVPTFASVEGFGGVCVPRLGSDAHSDCLVPFERHLRHLLFGERSVDGAGSQVHPYILRKDFDYLQRLVLLDRIASRLRAVQAFGESHPFARIDEEVVALLRASLQQTPELFRGSGATVHRAYLDATNALHHPSLVNNDQTMPDLHRILLLCPYFLPVLSVILRSLASAKMA